MKLFAKSPMRTVLLAGGVVLLTLIAFWPVQYNGFINFDDDIFITQNPAVFSGISWEGLKWAFTIGPRENNEKGYYTFHPLTWISFMLDCELFGLNPRGHHLANLSLHLINAVILFLLLSRITGKPGRSAFVACLFGVHPLHVESVAWAVERKDTLSALFGFLTIWAYIRYLEKPNGKRYSYIIVFFLLGLLSKTILVTLPFVLLLLDFWPLKRIGGRENVETVARPEGETSSLSDTPADSGSPYGKETFFRLIGEKTPLFVISFLFCILTFLDQRWAGAVSALDATPLPTRLFNVVHAYWEYIAKMLWPMHLSVLYPWDADNLTLGKVILAAGILIAVTMGVLWRWKKYPYLVTGWFWYLGVLLPVVGLVQIGTQSMADRYTYLSLIGLFLAITWLLSEAIGSWGRIGRWVLCLSAIATLILLAFLTRRQVGYWKDSITLFKHSLSVSDKATVLHINLGSALMKTKQYEESIQHSLRALDFNPGNISAIDNLATGYINIQQYTKAEQLCREALQKNPENTSLLKSMSVALMRMGPERWSEAKACLEKSLQINPHSSDTHICLGDLFVAMGKDTQAKEHYRQALQQNPYQPVALNVLGLDLIDQKKYQEGIQYYRRALEVDPYNPSIKSNLAMAYTLIGKYDEAIELFSQALSITAQNADIHCNLGAVLLATGRIDGALEHFQRALELDPSLQKAQIGQIRARQAKDRHD
jgi:protein O-mannosyl-transferase